MHGELALDGARRSQSTGEPNGATAPPSFRNNALIVNQFIFGRHGSRYCRRAGDFRGPVIGAAGTRFFEPERRNFYGHCRAALPGLAYGRRYAGAVGAVRAAAA